MLDARFFQQSYDRSAATYDARFEAQQAPKIHGLLAALPANLTPRLDAGAGTGLAARLTGLSFVALDASAGMLRHAIGARVQGDLYRLPFTDAAFGVAICVTALIDFDDPTPALDELLRVLRPGGWLGVSVLAHAPIDRVWSALARHGTPQRLTLGSDVGFIMQRGINGAADRSGE